MAYLAFYRMFRPATFDEVVRQEHIVRILKNQLASDKIGHAYLFCGPRGTGKTTLAKIFARTINCEDPVNGSPCGKCAACKALAEGGNLDIYEIDAASNNGVDEMRDLREKVQYPPVAGKYKVYIIDEVHMLTQSAFNAVLKTLEEPPRHAVFILATTEPQKIPATILSRCMRFDFKLIPQKDLEELVKSVLLKTGKEFEEEAVSAIARAGAGSARDSLSIADMCASYSRGKLTYEDVNAVLGSTDYAKVADICGAILKENASEALSLTEEIISEGKSVGILLKDMLNFLNICTVVKVCRSAREIVNLPEEMFNTTSKVAEAADGHKLLRVTEILSKAENELRYSSNGRITLETAVFKSSAPQTDYNIDALIGRINALENKLKNGEYSCASAVTATPAKAEVKRAFEFSETAFDGAELPEEPLPHKHTVSELISDDGGESPFAPSQTKSSEGLIQASLWESNERKTENPVSQAFKPATESEKSTVFAKFIRSLRTTHKKNVLFALCMDLSHKFEGEKLVLITDNAGVFKGLSREENANFIGEVLRELGVESYELRFAEKAESEDDKALKELKKNFEGSEIEIKE